MTDNANNHQMAEHEHKWVCDKNSALLSTLPPQAWYECSICGARKTFFLNQEPKQEAADNVNNPSHYTQGGIECIDAIEAALTPEEFRGYLKGNITKYIWRERLKGGVEDIKKAAWYIDKLRSVCD